MNRNRIAVIIAGSALLSALCACTERTMENMEPTGEVVEVVIDVPDSTCQFSSEQTEVEDYSLHELPDFK